MHQQCGEIDQHKWHCYDTFQMEKKIQIQSRENRATTSLFVIYCVNTWLMYKWYTSVSESDTHKLTQQEFYCQLAENITIRRKFVQKIIQELVETLIKIKAQDCTKFCDQGRCRVCIKACPTIIRSSCEDNLGKTLYFCDEQSGWTCFQIHVQSCHS